MDGGGTRSVQLSKKRGTDFQISSAIPATAEGLCLTLPISAGKTDIAVWLSV